MDWDAVQAMRNITYTNMTLLQAEIKMQGMIAENKQREIEGKLMAYTFEDFNNLIEECGVHHNAVVSSLHQR